MAIQVQTPDGRSFHIDGNIAVIGRDPRCEISLPGEDSLHARHATIKRVANKWMIQSEGDWLLRVGEGVPGRKSWLTPNDVIHLTEMGVRLIFLPAETKLGLDSKTVVTTSHADERNGESPPPLPWSTRTDDCGPSTYSQGTGPRFTSSDVTPILWNPMPIRIWAFFLGWGFGAWLLAANWRSLGQFERAKRAMIWFYGFPAFLLGNLFVPLRESKIIGVVAILIYVAWVLLEHEPQLTMVRAQFGKRFIRKPWGTPVFIALGCLLAYVTLVGLATMEGWRLIR